MRQTFHLVVIDFLFCIQAVRDRFEPFARHIERHTVRQVSAFSQTHAEERIAGIQQGKKHRLIRLRATIGLNIGSFGTEQFFNAINRQRFDHINKFTAAVIALAGIAFSVFIGELAALRFHHGGAGVVFRSDQLDMVLLALIFMGDGGIQLRINSLNSGFA